PAGQYRFAARAGESWFRLRGRRQSLPQDQRPMARPSAVRDYQRTARLERIKPDIERRRRMGERADADDVDAGFSYGKYVFDSNASGRFQQCLTFRLLHRAAQIGEREIV